MRNDLNGYVGSAAETFDKSEAVARRCSVKKMFLEISQNSQENTCARVSFSIKLQGPATLLKKRLWHRCFPVNFAKFLRTLFLTEHLQWLLLDKCSSELAELILLPYFHGKSTRYS